MACSFIVEPSFSQQPRIHSDYEGWSRMIPTHAKLQFAGGMGLVSAGAGWDYGRHNQWETDFLLGFLPAKYADETHITLTLRQNYIPWNISLSSRFAYEPLACGLYFNFISGERFWMRQPDKYPGTRYYSFVSRMRIHLSLGQRIRWNFQSDNLFRSVSLYYEFSANDLNIISKVTNSELKLSDILFFSVGLKFHIQPHR